MRKNILYTNRDVVLLISQLVHDDVIYRALIDFLCIQDSTPIDGIMEVITTMPTIDMYENEDSVIDMMTLYTVYINYVSKMEVLSDAVISAIEVTAPSVEVGEQVKLVLDVLIRQIILSSIDITNNSAYFKIGYVGREFILFASRGYLDGELLV